MILATCEAAQPTTRKPDNVPARLVAAVREADRTRRAPAAGRPVAAFSSAATSGASSPCMSEADFRFLTQRSDPGPGWPERKPQRRRLPRRERPEQRIKKKLASAGRFPTR